MKVLNGTVCIKLEDNDMQQSLCFFFQLLKRTIRVDHVEEYRVPKYHEYIDEETRRIWEEGCAPKPVAVTESAFD